MRLQSSSRQQQLMGAAAATVPCRSSAGSWSCCRSCLQVRVVLSWLHQELF